MIGEAVRAGLRRQGFAVDWVRDGIAAEQALLAETYDACLIDLGLPRKATSSNLLTSPNSQPGSAP